jgi:hypothetical protein
MLDYLNILSIEVLEKDQATTRYGQGENGAVIIITNKALKALSEIKRELRPHGIHFIHLYKRAVSGYLKNHCYPKDLMVIPISLVSLEKRQYSNH